MDAAAGALSGTVVWPGSKAAAAAPDKVGGDCERDSPGAAKLQTQLDFVVFGGRYGISLNISCATISS
jgi:hypothetical protein